MSEVHTIIKLLEQTSSTKEKQSILTNHRDNELLKTCFRLAYSPTVQFYIKQLPTVTSHKGVCSLQEVLQKLENSVASRVVTGNEAKEYITHLLESLTDEYSDVLKRVILKDMKCGVGKTLANKVWKGLIVVPPRQGACSMNEKSLKKMKGIKNLAIELKSDGSYAASICGEESTMMSRNGNALEIPSLQEHLSCGSFSGFALEGELIYDPTKATREEGNGYINKIIRGTATQENIDNVYYQVWDCIDTDYYTPKGEYPSSNKDRRNLLECMVNDYNGWCLEKGVTNRILLIDRKENVTVEEANTIFEQYVKNGFEGAIVKDMDATWSDKPKPTYCIKLKRKEPCDLRVVGTYEGKEGSKYVGMLGGLNCESECGRIIVSVGSGFNDEERQEFLTNPPPVIEVEYDSITKDKKTGQESLFLPIYKRPRYDKSTVDNYQEILDKQRIK